MAVRRAVMTGVSQLTGQISQMNAQKLGTDYFEVDYHSGARPEHREWQGKVYTMQQLIDICGLGTATGLNGVNCYHEYYPFFPGISKRNWTDEWLEEQNRLEDEPRAYRGKEYTRYEALQKQRQMETSMRAQRQKIRGMEEAGCNKDDIIIAKARYQGQLAEYKAFSSQMGIKTQMNRVYIDGLGRIAPNEPLNANKAVEIIKNADKRISFKMPKGKLRDDVIDIDSNKYLANLEKERRIELESRKYKELTIDEFKKMKHPILKEERKVIYGKGHYQGYINSSNARKLNNKLRNGEVLTGDYEGIAATLQNVINKNVLDEDIMVYRYVTGDALKSIAGVEIPKYKPGKMSKNELWEMFEDLPRQIAKDAEYVEKGFLSTSGVLDKNVMSDKAVFLKIKAPKGTPCYITTNNKESEIIFGKNTKLRILKTSIQDNKTAHRKVVLECIIEE